MILNGKIAINTWTNWNECSIKEQGGKVLQHPTASDTRPNATRSDALTNHIPESRPVEQGQKENEPRPSGEQPWQSIGELARELAEKAKAGAL